MQDIDRRSIKNYFKPFPMWAVYCIGVGLLLLPLKGLGLIPIIIGVLGIVLQKKPSDEQMDAWFQEEIKFLNQRALKKLGVDESECVMPPVPIYGPQVENASGADLLLKKGSDDKLRYSPVDFSVLNCGQEQLFCYQCCYDRTTGEPLAESTHEYFYRDVVDVATKTESEQFDVNVVLKGKSEKVKLTKSESFVLITSGGTDFSVFLQDPALLNLKQTKGGRLDASHVEKMIQAVRKMLREKKSERATAASTPLPQPLPTQRESRSHSGHSDTADDSKYMPNGPVVTPHAVDDTTAKLRKLKGLLSEGLIDQTEFDAEKRKLLEKL